MKKIGILLIVLMVVSVGLLSGCTGNNNSKSISTGSTNWEVTNTGHTYSDTSPTGISSAYIMIKNTGSKTTTYLVDFEFIPIEQPETGFWSFNNGASGSRLKNQIDGIQTQKQITVPVGETRKVSCTTNPNPSEGWFIGIWYYSVAPIS